MEKIKVAIIGAVISQTVPTYHVSGQWTSGDKVFLRHNTGEAQQQLRNMAAV